MSSLPTSLSIGLWLVGSIWIVGLIAYLSDAPGHIVWASLLIGVFAGVVEWATRRRATNRSAR
jgi:hypothetical protein